MIERIQRVLRNEGEEGVAMMIAVVLLSVMTTLAVMSLTVAQHVDSSTTRGRDFTQALHVAESGVEAALARIQGSNGSFTGTITGTTEEGNYRATVTGGSRSLRTIDAVGGVRSTYTNGVWVDRTLGSHRRLQVTVRPPRSFDKALYSYTTLVTKNGDTVTGDIWANQSVIVEAGATVNGSAVGATGYIDLAGGALVTGDVWGGGFNAATNTAVILGNNASVGGNAKASVVDPPDPITCGGAAPSSYAVDLGAGSSIGGNMTSWGAKTGSGTVSGTILNHTCTSAPATIPMPPFTYNAGNYDATTLHEFGTASTPSSTAVSAFQSYLASHINDMKGAFYVNQTSPVNQDVRLDLTGIRLTGDLYVISNTPIFFGGGSDTGSDSIAMFASTYDPPTGTSCDVNNDKSECSVHLKNNFSSTGSTALLVWAPYGPVGMKNNAVQFGAVYGESIELKNNQSITYDPRIDRIAGFGAVTLEVTRWLELNAS